VTAPQELVDEVLRRSSADGCVAIVSEHTETNLRWAANSLTTNGQMRTRSLTVVSTFDKAAGTSVGVVTRAVSSLEEVEDVVRRSEAAGREAEPAEDASPLVEPYPNDDPWGDDPAVTSVEVFERFAPALAAAFRDWGAADRALYGFAEHQMTSYFVGTSTGLRRRFDQPDGRLEMNGKSNDLARSAWDGVHTRDFTDVDVAAIVDKLAQRLSWADRRIDLPAGRYETLIPPSAVADFLIYTYWTASARDAEEGRSVFAGRDGGTRLGEQLSPHPLTLRSDPRAPGLETAPFEIATSSLAGVQSVFDNGAPVDATSWITEGRLTNLIRTRAWARRTEAAAQPYVDNLILDAPAGAPSLEDMIAGTERGLLLTCLWYLREVDPQTLLLTGLTRDGVYLVEDGRVQGAVNNFRFNESPVDLLRRVTEVGRTEPTLPREWNDYFRRTAMPTLRVPDFHMSTVSPAS
jgi:predicted Zn-dependent protease